MWTGVLCALLAAFSPLEPALGRKADYGAMAIALLVAGVMWPVRVQVAGKRLTPP